MFTIKDLKSVNFKQTAVNIMRSTFYHAIALCSIIIYYKL